MKRVLSLLFLLMLAPAAMASEFAGYDLIIPIAGRTPGAHGSNWRTDLYVTNAERRSIAPPETVSILFTRDGQPEQIMTVQLPSRATRVFQDVIREEFGHVAATGVIRVVALSPAAKITARARIYNVGSGQGEYGQTVQALPVSKLSRETYLPGLSGLGGNRTNIGIANPTSVPIVAFISLYDAEGEFRGGVSTAVASRSVKVINDVFSQFQTGPLDDATVQVTSSFGVYAWASVVRSDTGDADFVMGTGIGTDDSGAVITPDCASPAPLRLAPMPADGWLVSFRAGYSPASTTATLAAKYAFTPIAIYEHALSAFHAELTPAVVAALRCEPSVRAIDQNALVPMP